MPLGANDERDEGVVGDSAVSQATFVSPKFCWESVVSFVRTGELQATFVQTKLLTATFG